MKYFLFLFLSLSCLLTKAQIPVFQLTEKKLGSEITKEWLYQPGDNPEMALPAYNDSAWISLPTSLDLRNDTVARTFKGICWFRLHFTADSVTANQVLALKIWQDGASQIYLDGKLLASFGTISGKDSSLYENPIQLPFLFKLPSAGSHVLAIRYANYVANYNLDHYSQRKAGPGVIIKDGNGALADSVFEATVLFAVLMFLAGLFLALGLLHLVMYLHLRNDVSNLFFSAFCLSICGCFIFPMAKTGFFADPKLEFNSGIAVIICVTLACGSLAYFTNVLFSRKKGKARIFAIICCINCILAFFSYQLAAGIAASLCATVSIDAFILIILAMIRKVEGARIIGAGFLLFLSLLILMMLVGIFQKGFHITLTGTFGQVWLILVTIGVLSMPASFSIFLAARYAKTSKSLKEQLVQVQLLSDKTIEQEAEKQRILQNRQAELEQEVSLRTAEVVRQKNEIERQHEALKEAKKKSDDLLLNILPEEVAEELKEKGRADAKLYDEVSVLFTDFVNFTTVSETLTPGELVAEIDHCFKAFDDIITRFGLEKIKTIGDAYMAVCGLPAANADHACATINAAIAIRDFVDRRKLENPSAFAIRIGIHSGPVVAGIVGVKKFAYDIWGDTVNTAARMEQHGEPGKINISGATYKIVKDRFDCLHRGELEAKHKGRLDMYFAESMTVAI